MHYSYDLLVSTLVTDNHYQEERNAGDAMFNELVKKALVQFVACPTQESLPQAETSTCM